MPVRNTDKAIVGDDPTQDTEPQEDVPSKEVDGAFGCEAGDRLRLDPVREGVVGDKEELKSSWGPFERAKGIEPPD